MASADEFAVYVPVTPDLHNEAYVEDEDDHFITPSNVREHVSDSDPDEGNILDDDLFNFRTTQADLSIHKFLDVTTVPSSFTPIKGVDFSLIHLHDDSVVDEENETLNTAQSNVNICPQTGQDPSPSTSPTNVSPPQLPSSQRIIPVQPDKEPSKKIDIAHIDDNSWSSEDNDFLIQSLDEMSDRPKNKPISVCNPKFVESQEESAYFTNKPACPFDKETPNASVNPGKTYTRFHKSSVKEVESLERDAKADKTHKQTKWGVTIFTEWLKFAGHSPEFESLPPVTLGQLIKQFYCEVRQKDGTYYSRSSLLCIRAALNRYLTSPPWSLPVNIITDPAFIGANSVVTGKIKKMKKEGLDCPERHPPITLDDLELLYSTKTLCNETPQALQHKVFFEISLHFGRRGRESFHDLKQKDIVSRLDEGEHEYATLAYLPYEKNHNSTSHHQSDHLQKMYSIKGPDCPVESLRFYLGKLNKDSDHIFQRPKKTKYETSSTWYTKQPIGINTIGQFMATMSQLAHLSHIYTNHCIRASCVTYLSRAGVGDQDITSVTGHRNIVSVQSYRVTEDHKRRKMSLKLSKAIGKSVDIDAALKKKVHFETEAKSDTPTPNIKSVSSPKRATDVQRSAETERQVARVQPSPKKNSTPSKNRHFPSPVRRSPRLQQMTSTSLAPANTSRKLTYPEEWV